MPSFSVVAGFEGFLFYNGGRAAVIQTKKPGLRPGLSIVNPFRRGAEHIERSVMQTVRFFPLAAAGVLSVCNLRAQFADSVVAYNPGSGFAAGYTNATAALGSPSRQTVDPDPTFGGTYPVDPFSPPYLSTQLVSLGAGGSLTVRLDTPAL